MEGEGEQKEERGGKRQQRANKSKPRGELLSWKPLGERKQKHFDRKPKQEKDGSEQKEQDEGVKKVEKRKNENDTNIAPFTQKGRPK